MLDPNEKRGEGSSHVGIQVAELEGLRYVKEACGGHSEGQEKVKVRRTVREERSYNLHKKKHSVKVLEANSLYTILSWTMPSF
jgi:hypothetical protein